MSSKTTSPLTDDALRQRLEYLYARRAAVNQLIRSLEDYTASPAMGRERRGRSERRDLANPRGHL